MKVRELKKLIDRLDPEADVFATTDDIAQWHQEVPAACLARKHEGGWLETRDRRSKTTNAVLLFVGRMIG